MSKTFDQSKDEIARLCQYFTTNRRSFLAPGVKEAHVRQSLIDPFFEILGWDLRNAAMVAPQYREVITEDSLDIEGHQKAPDYTFRLGTLAKFYVEAKKCGINISADPAPAYQLRRYGFSAKLPLSILTDFEELGVYDCASRPRPNDKASHARIQYFGFAEYPDRWREIWDVFSREAVWSGTFDQYAVSKRKRGTSEVDGEFLKDIEGWRDSLARNIALRNLYLDYDDLNTAVQRTIDRLIFLRMAEDRGLESYGQLLKLCEQPEIYARFIKMCRKADEKYNSGIFHFQKEDGVSEEHDRLTPALTIDDKVIKPILQSLYFEHGSPYHFGVLPVEILGTVYERFLGKVIRLTAGHQAKVEEKPEVRKAGGVYYTPAYIVNYIVLNTVGKQIEGKSPADLAGSKTKPPFRVLDMACGSGSFLLGAYQFLLDHCLKWYLANPSKKHANAVYQNAKGETCLSIGERKRILTSHIFGVDIDRQAVETTKLSLLLKALEGENDTSLSKQMTLFHERALPNLSDNIKCGNSLIASDFSMLPEDLVRVNAFDWPAQFPDAMKVGGFDAIIGNPPYILLQNEFRDDDQLDYFRQNYKGASFKLDTYHLFIEQGIKLCRVTGRLSLITPSNFLTNNHLDTLRRFILQSTQPEEVVVVDGGVFAGVSVDNAVFVFRAGYSATKPFPMTRAVTEPPRLRPIGEAKVNPARVLAEQHALFTSGIINSASHLWDRLAAKCQPLGDFADVNFGKQLRDRKKFLRDVIEVTSRKAIPQTHVACVTGKDIEPYFLTWSKLACLNDTVAQSGGCWDETKHEAKGKLLTRQIGRFPSFAFDDIGYHCLNTIFMVTVREPKQIEPKYLLGILNSKLLRALWTGRFYDQRQTFPKIKGTYLKELPIAFNSADKARNDRMVELVEKMLALTPKLRGATSESEKAALQNAVTTTDAEIDRLVYELYGLTEDEIKIVEGEL
ncbi:MAG: N-6 DNA methylase [Candidatus Aminicenantes bacterium]|nr:N-6 DNA methylase [Candidatus Aminicenantes bacterium]